MPCVVSLPLAARYNIVEQIFTANAHDPGFCGNAANTAAFPLTVAAPAAAVVIGDGAVVRIRPGAKDREQAHRSVGRRRMGLFCKSAPCFFRTFPEKHEKMETSH